MKLPVLLAATAFALLAVSGCFGLPPGAAGHGDVVTVHYTAHDLATGQVLRNDRTVSFTLGSGDSGLGLAFERAVRGQAAGTTFSFEVHGDSSLAFTDPVNIDRALSPIPRHQSVPRSEFDATPFKPATVGKEFDAYGIYKGVVTSVNETLVAFTVSAKSEAQREPVPSVGAVLLTTMTDSHLLRSLEPTVGATFVIQPPSPFNPSTPLGLTPGSYKVVGATATQLQYLHAQSTASDLIGKELRFTVTIDNVADSTGEVEPVDGNYGVRQSPQVNGDPASVLGDDALAHDEADAAHDH